MQRTTSNMSDDILVSTPAQQQPPPRRPIYSGTLNTPESGLHRQPTRPFRTTVSNNNGVLQVRFGSRVSKERLKAILKAKPRPVSVQSKSVFKQAATESVQNGPEDGPNHRGTYSKEYTLQHPEIKFIHRGQGRYIPASELNQQPPAPSPRPRRYVLINFHFALYIC